LLVFGHNFESKRLQRIARQDGNRFAELHVACRLATPQVVVIHRRKIVMD